MEYLSRFLRWSWQNKRNFGICLAATSLFIFLLFPFDELTDRVSSEVSKQTGNQYYLQMDGLNVSLLTGLKLELDKVLFQAPSLPPIKINSVEYSPSLFSLLEKFPLGTVIAEGLLRGTLEATASPGAKGGAGQKRQQVAVRAEKVSLEQLSQYLKLPVLIKGQAQLDIKSLTDFTFADQPEADINLIVQKLVVPATTIFLGGPIDIPDMKIGTAQLKGKLSSSILQIDSLKMGSPEDDLSANISGQINVRMQLKEDMLVPVIGGYDLSVEMSLKKSVVSSIGMFLSLFLDGYMREQADGTIYRFKMKADNTKVIPSFGSIQ